MTPCSRTRIIFDKLVKHLHQFVNETKYVLLVHEMFDHSRSAHKSYY